MDIFQHILFEKLDIFQHIFFEKLDIFQHIFFEILDIFRMFSEHRNIRDRECLEHSLNIQWTPSEHLVIRGREW